MYTHHESVKPHCCPSFSQMADVLLAMLTSCWLRWSRGGSWKNILARLRMKFSERQRLCPRNHQGGSGQGFWPMSLTYWKQQISSSWYVDLLQHQDVEELFDEFQDCLGRVAQCFGFVSWLQGHVDLYEVFYFLWSCLSSKADISIHLFSIFPNCRIFFDIHIKSQTKIESVYVPTITQIYSHPQIDGKVNH